MYRKDEDLKLLAEDVINEFEEFKNLREGVRIAFLMCDRAKKSNGKDVYADTAKVQDKLQALAPYDFIITFYEPNCIALNDEKMRILMKHELMHIGYEPGGVCRIVPHDVEDFASIIKEHGMDWCL